MKTPAVVILGVLLLLPGVLGQCKCNLSGNYTGTLERRIVYSQRPLDFKDESGTFAVDFDRDILQVTFHQLVRESDIYFHYLNFFQANVQYLQYDGKCAKRTTATRAARSYRFTRCVPENLIGNATESDTDVMIYQAPGTGSSQQPTYKIVGDCVPVSVLVGSLQGSYVQFSNFKMADQLTPEFLTRNVPCAFSHLG